MCSKNIFSKLVLLVGLLIITYGITRWWTVRNMIITHETIVDTIHKENVIDASRDTFTANEVSKELMLIREKFFLSQGIYQWMKGLILSIGFGLAIVVSGIYMLYRTKK